MGEVRSILVGHEDFAILHGFGELLNELYVTSS
jgi:hypothetical protein